MTIGDMESPLDRTADTAVSDVHPFGDFFSVLVDCKWFFDIGCFCSVILVAGDKCKSV